MTDVRAKRTTKKAKKPKQAKEKDGEQLALPRTGGHGGRREGAGRKPGTGRRNVRHVTRPKLGKRMPVHITMRMRPGRPSLRAPVLRAMFARIVRETSSEDFHVAVFSLQDDHVHMICESTSEAALSSGIRRVAIRFSLRMNKLFGRTFGKNWADRYHRRDLRTPHEVRNAIVYVLMNAKKHCSIARDARFLDPMSSAIENDVWEDVALDETIGDDRACGPPRFWLLAHGWKKRGLVRSTEAPA